MKTSITITGVQPSGRPHIGNYFGAMKQVVDLQDKHQLFVFVADYHAMTTIHDKDQLRKNIEDLILDYLAVGLDPEKTVIYRQSDIPEVTELSWIFSTLVTTPWLERAHAFKDKTEKGIEASVGLFTYPVLMAADILLPGATVVPVGRDQIQHVEMAREIARKFNATYGNTFAEPNELVSEATGVVPGTDGQKMSKSYGNIIPLFGTDDEIKKAIMGIVTDSTAVEEPKDPDTCTVFAIHKLVTPADELEEIRSSYLAGGTGYGEYKKKLLENYLKYIGPMRKQREYYAGNPGIVRQILDSGSQSIQKIAKQRMKEVREKTGLK
jgi:tryptophanyl-tRNA synthetase